MPDDTTPPEPPNNGSGSALGGTPLYAANVRLGPKDPANPVAQRIALPLLQHGTTYYWRVVSKTMAGVTAKGPTVSFTTSGLWAAHEPSAARPIMLVA